MGGMLQGAGLAQFAQWATLPLSSHCIRPLLTIPDLPARNGVHLEIIKINMKAVSRLTGRSLLGVFIAIRALGWQSGRVQLSQLRTGRLIDTGPARPSD